jgi:hypothetical protein
MLPTQTKELEKYTPDWVEMFLRNYDVLVGDAAELVAEWDEMHEQEQIHHRSISMQVWGMRVTLGELYRAGRLTPDQVARLADLDRALLEEAANVEIAYGPSLQRLVEDLLDWGTPLTEVEGTVRLEMPLKVLPALAQALAGEVVPQTELETATP